jgi:hypothetical protein
MRYLLCNFFYIFNIFLYFLSIFVLYGFGKMPRGEPAFFTSNPAEKPGRQLCTHSIVPGNVSTSPAAAVPSVQAAVTPKSPTQSKSSSKKKNESKKNSPASTTTVAPKSPTQSKSSKKKNESYKKSLYDIAKALKAASPRPPLPPVVVAPKEAAPSLAPMVSTALGTLLERKASSASGSSSSGSSSDDDSSSGSSSDDGSLSASSQPVMVTGGSIIGSGTAIVSAAELIAAVSAATSTTVLSTTNPSIEAVTKEVLDAVLAPAHDVHMEPSSAVFVKVKFFILILTLDLKCVL